MLFAGTDNGPVMLDIPHKQRTARLSKINKVKKVLPLHFMGWGVKAKAV